MTSPFDEKSRGPSPALDEAVDVLLWFGALMLRSGNTAVRTREWVEVIGRKMGLDSVAVGLSLDGITASVHRSGEWITAMREIGPPGINALRIGELERLARTLGPEPAPWEIAAKLAEIESEPHRYPSLHVALAIGAASSAFAFLNGAAAPEMIAAAVGGGVGQGVRSWLSHRQLNHYGAATLSAITASGLYAAAAALAGHAGFELANYPAGFIASVLFLVPGFPLVGGLFDLLQYQILAAVSRLAYGVMILLAVALGLSIVIAVAEVDLSRQPRLEVAYPLKLLLRAVASFAASSAIAMLFNSPPRTVLAAGLLASGANGLRLILIDTGMMAAPAAYFAALSIGLVALLVEQRFNVPRMAMTVAPIVIMIPGLYAFQTIVLFNSGQMLEALEAFAACGFIVGALAMGLATARFFSRTGPASCRSG